MAGFNCKKIIFALFIAAIVALCPFFSPGLAAPTREMPKRHFLSWESSHRPEEFRRIVKKSKPLRRFKVSCRRISKLKSSTFWNRRPYQFAAPFIANGRLYVGADSGFFYAFDIGKKKKLWTFKTEGPIHGRPHALDDTVFVADTKAFVYAIDANSGQEKWRTKLDVEIFSEPVPYADKLYVVDSSGRLYALQKDSGFEAWHTDPSEKSFGFSIRRQATPVVADGLVITGTSAGTVIAYRADTGDIAWVKQVGNKQSQLYDVDSEPLVTDGKMYVSSADGILACLDVKTGNILWTANAGGPNDIKLSEGKLFAAGQGILTALDPESGSIFWQQDFETPEISTPAGGEHFVAVASTMDKFYLVDSETGDVVYEHYIRKGSFSDPFTVGDRVYLLINNGKLYSYKIRELKPLKVRGEK